MPLQTPAPLATKANSLRPDRRWWLQVFAPAEPADVVLQDPVEIKAQYRYWQRRILFGTLVGYALFYFVRKNISIALPAIGRDLGIGKAELGLFLTLHGVLYGFSKFANGFLGDHANARTFMAAGLILSAAMNICFGCSSTALAMGLFWMLNGWVQGMGFPPCARLMAHWFPPKELATRFSVWNTSHSIGAGLVVVLCGYLVLYHWRLCFFVPAGLAILGAIFLLLVLRDTPPSLGLPEVEGTQGAPKTISFSSALLKQVFANKHIWFLSLASFCVYTIRYAVLDWGPTFLTETRDLEISTSGWMVAAFETAGVAGMLACGWITDRLFAGRGARVSAISMGLAAIFLLCFWKVPTHSLLLSTSFLCGIGFFLYGPQALVGIVVVNLATKRLAGTAVGFTSIFSYASTVLSGWGLGNLVQTYGWNTGFGSMFGCCLVGTLLLSLSWRAKAHGYDP